MSKKSKDISLNKKKLIQTIFRKISVARDGYNMTRANIETVINSLFSVVIETLNTGGKIKLAKFGIFSTSIHEARSGRNPITGTPVIIPKCQRPVFKFCKALKTIIDPNVDVKKSGSKKKVLDKTSKI